MAYVIDVSAVSKLDSLISRESCDSFESAAKSGYEILIQEIEDKLSYYYKYPTKQALALEVERFEVQRVNTEFGLSDGRPTITFLCEDLDLLIEVHAPE